MSYDYVSSLPAYKEPKDSKRGQVFIAIKKNGPINTRKLALLMGWPINCVVGRVNELATDGMIMDYGKKIDPETNRKVSYWIEKPIAIQQSFFQ